VRVLLDANALMMPAQFRIDLFDELRGLVGHPEPVVIPAVIGELERLARGRGAAGIAARCGLILAVSCRVVESGPAGAAVDEQILNYAKRERCMVMTNDRALRGALLSQNVPVISLKNQKKLDILR
jgi:rRNA-processing protein FCF1